MATKEFQLVSKAQRVLSATARSIESSDRYLLHRSQPSWSVQVAEAEPAMYGGPVLVRPRLGQGTFRVLVTDTYRRRCAVTGEKALPVLQAAHIKPVAAGGVHGLDNGLLLRSDVHTLFDRGYATVAPDRRFMVSRRLRTDFDNGEHYYQLQGNAAWLPEPEQERPSQELLEWHRDTVFLR